MEMLDANKLVLFIAFVIPGFISLKTYELLFPIAPKETAKQVIDAVSYSSVNYALLLWPIYEIETHNIRADYPTVYILFYFFALFVAPISWACIFTKLRQTTFFQKSVPHPTLRPWDFVFAQRKSRWVLVTLKDGKRYGGLYDADSFASSSPAPDQLFLEQSWHVNDAGGFDRAKETTAGILILCADVATIEFFQIEYPNETTKDANDGSTETDNRRLSAKDDREGVSADRGSQGAEWLPTRDEPVKASS